MNFLTFGGLQCELYVTLNSRRRDKLNLLRALGCIGKFVQNRPWDRDGSRFVSTGPKRGNQSSPITAIFRHSYGLDGLAATELREKMAREKCQTNALCTP
jgi:hypothetical protein